MKKIPIMSTTLVASAGMLFTACSSMHHERRQASYETGGAYSANESSDIYESSGSQPSYNYNTSQNYAAQSGQSQNIVIPLHQEELNVGKRTVDAGQVTIRKIVTTETVNQPIELRHETVVIDRENTGAGQQFSANTSANQNNQNYSQNSSYSTSSSVQTNPGWQPGAELQERVNTGYPSSNQQVGSPRALEQQQERAGISQNEASGASTQSSANYYSSQSASTSASGSANVNSSANLNQNAQGTQVGAPFQEQTYTIRLQEEQPVINKTVVQTGEVVARKNTQMQQQNISQQLRREQVQVDKNGVAAQNVQINGNLNAAGATVNESAGAQLNNTNKVQDASQQQNDSQSNQQNQQEQK